MKTKIPATSKSNVTAANVVAAAAAANGNAITIGGVNAPKTIVTPSLSVTITPKTETSESSLPFQTPAATIISNISNVNKRPISLDLKKTTAKLLATPHGIDSPDTLKPLTTPDVEKIILASNLLQTPQIGPVFPTKLEGVTLEQEEFGKGFDDALSSLRNGQIGTNTTKTTATATLPTSVTTAPVLTTNNVTGMSGGSITYKSMETFPVAIKDEPQNASSTPPVSPIDMETQEKIKLERKRQRNRVAASKCRKRKLERISQLEDKVKMLKGENTELAQIVKKLKDHVAQLKQDVIVHHKSGCVINLAFTNHSDAAFLQGK